jgi:hypothetical protein
MTVARLTGRVAGDSTGPISFLDARDGLRWSGACESVFKCCQAAVIASTHGQDAWISGRLRRPPPQPDLPPHGRVSVRRHQRSPDRALPPRPSRDARPRVPVTPLQRPVRHRRRLPARHITWARSGPAGFRQLLSVLRHCEQQLIEPPGAASKGSGNDRLAVHNRSICTGSGRAALCLPDYCGAGNGGHRPAATTSFHFVSLADARCRFARSCPK